MTTEVKRIHAFTADDCDRVESKVGGASGYPPCFPNILEGRVLRRMSAKAKLKNIAVVQAELPPGCALAFRMAQSLEEEFFYILEGEVTLITDEGEELMHAGDCVGFPAGDSNGHQLINKSDQVARFLEIADLMDGNESDYPDIDLKAVNINGKRTFVNRKNEPYES